MSYKTVFRDVMRAYEADRDRNAALLRERKEEVYTKIPRLREIDIEIAEAGIKAARQILDGNDTIKELHKHSTKLLKEKKNLVAKNGIAEGYLTDIYNCYYCHDTGYIINSERCRCLKQRMINKYYDLSSIKGLLEVENFDSFDLRYFSENIIASEGRSPYQNIQRIYRIAMDFIERFGDEFQNLLFYGDTGLGKTFMCNCVAKELLDRGHTVLYVTAPRIFKLVEDYRFNRNEMEDPDYAIDAVTDVDLLVLDDLGAEFSTVVTNAALFDIINQRLLAKKPTLISTNLSLVEFEAQYSARIFSRFLGNYQMSKFIGDDIRAKKKYGG